MIPTANRWKDLLTDPVSLAESSHIPVEKAVKICVGGAKAALCIGGTFMAKPGKRIHYLPEEDTTMWHIVETDGQSVAYKNGFHMYIWGKWHFRHSASYWSDSVIWHLQYETVRMRGRNYILQQEIMLFNREDNVLLEYVAYAWYTRKGKVHRKKIRSYTRRLSSKPLKSLFNTGKEYHQALAKGGIKK